MRLFKLKKIYIKQRNRQRQTDGETDRQTDKNGTNDTVNADRMIQSAANDINNINFLASYGVPKRRPKYLKRKGPFGYNLLLLR